MTVVIRKQSQHVLSWYRISFILSFLLLLIHTMTSTMVIVTAQSSTSGSCAMDIWIFASFEGCQASDAPIANGKIYADGQCHTIETDLDASNSNYQFFPGNYRVQCIDTNKIRFSDSACLDNVCTVTSLSTTTSTVCDRDNTSPASLYSRLDPPVYIVQDPSNASVGSFYTCLKLDGSDVTLTFVVFGDCTQSDCIITPTVPTTPTPTIPPITSTTTPTVSIPSTVSPTTSPPIIIVQPTTPAPIPTGTIPTTTSAPIINTTTTAPVVANVSSEAPSLAPSIISVTPPIPIPVGTAPIVVPTKPVVAPTIPSPITSSTPPMTAPITNGLINDSISVGIQLSPMNQMISSSMSSIEMWEDVTKLQIKSISESELNIIVFAMDISNITERIIDRNKNNNNNNTSSTTSNRQRYLQTNNNDTEDGTTIAIGTTITTALQIFFDVSMSYSIKNNADTPPTLATIFTSSFDTEQDRSNYLIKLVTNDNIFTSARLIEVLYVHDKHGNTVPTTSPARDNIPSLPTTDVTSNSTNNNSTNIALFASLAAGGISLIVFAVLGFVYYQRRQTTYHHRNPNSKSTNSHDVIDIPSDNDDEYMNHNNGPVGPLNFTKHHSPSSPQQQRWTNEIVVDPSADDVSTLGGSVLAGYLDPTTTKNDTAPNNHVEDEPTASVNLDYDYNRNQYRSDVEDRSRMTNPTTFTNGTAFTASKLGMNQNAVGVGNDNTMLYSDDVSFEELYADMIDTNTTTNDDTNKGQNPNIVMNHPRVQQLANIVKPYEIKAPPGKLGMVVDTPNGSVPIVRAIKPDSVLYGTVCIGDRLISVDHKDVTSMTALDVSNLISLKQNQHRLLVFCRIQQQQQLQEQPMVITSGISPQNRVSGVQQQQPSPVATTTTSATSYQ